MAITEELIDCTVMSYIGILPTWLCCTWCSDCVHGSMLSLLYTYNCASCDNTTVYSIIILYTGVFPEQYLTNENMQSTQEDGDGEQDRRRM